MCSFQMLDLLLLLLASAASADQQCLEHGACAAQCAASLRVCIADCSPTPPDEPDEERGKKHSLHIFVCITAGHSLATRFETDNHKLVNPIYFVFLRPHGNVPHQRDHCRGKRSIIFIH